MAEVRALVPGTAGGRALVLTAPLSFWGGIDPDDGTIIDRHHPQAGQRVTGTVLVLPSGRGSSSSSSVFAESIRAGTGPVAIVLAEPDGILALGALVASKLYGTTTPVVVVEDGTYRSIGSGDEVQIRSDGDGWRIEVSEGEG